ncbi:gp53-like domain-containing protein [Xanthobacter autotrophicus]|uniref:gp53-like domain-containing protein n=1 Tax=Xanthobacter autotrophicus TaxID=280 RepID=UPI0037281461
MPITDQRTESRNYPLPYAGNKLPDDVERLRQALAALDADVAAVLLLLAGKAAAAHVHALGDISGLVTALAGKAALAHIHALADLSDTDVAGAANGQLLKRVGTKWQPSTLLLGDISGWEMTVTSMIAAQVAAVVGSAPGTLDTLDELAQALGDDPNFATTLATSLGNRLRVDAAQGLTAGQQTQARGNIGLGALAVLNALTASTQIGDGLLTFAKLAVAAVASQAEAEAGAASDKLMTAERTKQAIQALAPTGAAALAATGWLRFPSFGLIIQWGRYGGGSSDPTITLPTAFLTACYGAFGTPNEGTGNAYPRSVHTSSLTTTSFVASIRTVSGGGGPATSTAPFYWFALGV